MKNIQDDQMPHEEENPLLSYFMGNTGRRIHKWIDYLDVYHRAFGKLRGKPIKFLEIGVQNGGSARMWREYFGPQAHIIGMDVDPRCKSLEEEGFEIWIGDQGDPKFWDEFSKKHPHLDVVLDDGGHTMNQQIVTFEALFKTLNNGGIYLCEDTHTSYFPFHGGGLRKKGTFHEYVKKLIDDMHAWYHEPLKSLESRDHIAKWLYSISVFDSIVLMEKRLKNPPLALARGYDGHENNSQATSFIDLRKIFKISES